MSNGFFSGSNPLFRLTGRFLDLVVLSFFFLLASLQMCIRDRGSRASWKWAVPAPIPPSFDLPQSFLDCWTPRQVPNAEPAGVLL